MQKNITEKGFTLVELIIVILILGIFSLLAITRFRSYYPVKLSGVAYKLKGDIRYAQQLAVSTEVICGISLEPSSEQYSIYQGSPANITTDPFTKSPLTVSFTSGAYAGIDIVNTNFGNDLSFDARGRPRDSLGVLLNAPGTLQLRYSNYNQTLTIEPDTGRINIQ